MGGTSLWLKPQMAWPSAQHGTAGFKGYRRCRRPLSWAIWFKSWWCLTGPSTWTQNATQPSPDTPKTGDRLKTAKHHLNPDANPAKNPPPQRAEVTSLKPIKEKKQAPARGHKTQRNLAQTRPKQQPPGDRLKTAKHHLNPDANPAKNPPPQRAEVTSLKPIKEKKQAPARGHKTQRNLAQTRPKQQPPGDRLKTAKHHLNPDANPAKNPPPQRAEVTSLKPIKEKKQAPARGHKTQRNLAQTRPKQQPPGDRLKTAKHHLNPDANPAKNPPPQRAEVTSLKPIKEKKQAPARGHKTQRNLDSKQPNTTLLLLFWCPGALLYAQCFIILGSMISLL